MLKRNYTANDVTLNELAEISEWVYPPEHSRKEKYNVNAGEEVDGWHMVNSRASTKSSGLRARSYQKDNVLVVGFKGTRPKGMFTQDSTIRDDLGNDIDLTLGFTPSQFFAARKFLLEQIEYAKEHNLEIVLTGHSLGGGLAQLLSSLEEKGENYSFPYVTFNAPGVAGNPAAPHPDVGSGLNISTDTDIVGQFSDTVGPRWHIGNSSGKNPHTLGTVIYSLAEENITNKTLGEVDQAIMPSRLNIQGANINNGQLRYLQRQLEVHMRAALRSDDSNRDALLAAVLADLFPDKTHYKASEINFVFLYRDDGQLKQLVLQKFPNSALVTTKIEHADEKDNHLIVPVEDIRKAKEKESPLYAKAQLNLLKAQAKLHPPEDPATHKALQTYIGSLDGAVQAAQLSNKDTHTSKRLADEAHRVRQILDPKADAEQKLGQLENLVKDTAKRKKGLGDRIAHAANNFIRKAVDGLLKPASQAKIAVNDLENEKAQKQLQFLQQQTVVVEKALAPEKVVGKIAHELEQQSSFWSRTLGSTTTAQKATLGKISLRQLLDWHAQFKDTSDSKEEDLELLAAQSRVAKENAQEKLQTISQLYIGYYTSHSILTELERKIREIYTRIGFLLQLENPTSGQLQELAHLQKLNQQLLNRVPSAAQLQSIATNSSILLEENSVNRLDVIAHTVRYNQWYIDKGLVYYLDRSVDKFSADVKEGVETSLAEAETLKSRAPVFEKSTPLEDKAIFNTHVLFQAEEEFKPLPSQQLDSPVPEGPVPKYSPLKLIFSH